ncbi:MAG: gamma carbonic anhydrase family protein [Gammaproteobacteria bacterium]|nr:gamma carbonic anhydrase family protein [Gammaproteobacteria bacterium]
MIYTLPDRYPKINKTSFIAPSADIIGSVIVGANASVWFNCVLRGDNDLITLGDNSNVQDCSVLHTDPGIPLWIDENVTIGHSTMLHGCHIGKFSLIGIGTIILNRAKIGENCIVGANTLITEGKAFPDRTMILGSPGKVVRELTDEEVEELHQTPAQYTGKIPRYRLLQEQ